MKTAWGIFWGDLKRLARNPAALLVAIGLVVLPCVYAWYSVVAMWSPYSHTDGLKVAVVSEDAGVNLADIDVGDSNIDLAELAGKIGGEKLDVGSLAIDAMRSDEHFDWQFVDSAQGRAGLESGEYYAEFVLPEHFTADFLSVLSGELERPTVEYWTNEKYNAVALEVTDAGAGVVDSVINRAFSALAADALTTILQDVAADLASAIGKGASALRTGLSGASSDLKSVGGSFDRIKAAAEKWRDSVSSVSGALDSLSSTAPKLRDAVNDSEQLLDDARKAVHKVSSAYSSALSEGGSALSKALSNVADRVSKAAANASTKQPDVDSALDKADKALAESKKLINALKKIDSSSKELDNLADQNEKLQSEVANLRKATSAVADAASAADEATKSLSDDVEKAIKNMKGRNDTFNSQTMPKVETSLDSLALVMGSLASALDTLDAQVEQSKALLNDLDGVLEKTESALDVTAKSLDEAGDSILAARTDLAALANSAAVKNATKITNLNVENRSAVAASPVSAQVQQVYPLNSYGAGVAPFYTCLAIWVGCFMLIAVMKLEVDPARFPLMRPWQGYVGRLMLFALFALLQGALVVAGDLVIGVEAVSAVAFVAAGLVIAFCFINIVFSMAITFKHVGKALAVIFLIVQIPGASGMYPIQLMPEFFQGLYPWLPFTYGMGAMREAIGGFYDGAYLRDLLWLVACGLAALVIALVVRPHVLNLNRLFDRKLADADVFIAEDHGLGEAVVENRPLMNSLLATAEGRAELKARIARFTQRYDFVRTAAPLAMVLLVACLAIVSAVLGLDIDGKLDALTAVIGAIVVVFCACVAFEYANDNATAQLAGLAYDVADPSAFADVLWEGDGAETEEAPGDAMLAEGIDADEDADAPLFVGDLPARDAWASGPAEREEVDSDTVEPLELVELLEPLESGRANEEGADA